MNHNFKIRKKKNNTLFDNILIWNSHVNIDKIPILVVRMYVCNYYFVNKYIGTLFELFWHAIEFRSGTLLDDELTHLVNHEIFIGDKLQILLLLQVNSNKSSINPGKSNNLGYRSMVNMNKEFNQSTDSLVRTTHARLSRLSSENNSKFGGRSQSLMEIGSALPKRTLSSDRGPTTSSSHIRSQSSSGLETSEMPIEQRRKNTLTKMKGLVIPEVNNEAMASPPPSASKLSTPPWKQQSSSEMSSSSKYSPAYKRKPFSVYGNGNNGHGTSTPDKRTSPTSSSNNNSTNVKSDDSDNDSAVSSGRSSLSHSSVSPPASPKSAKNRPQNETIQEASSEAVDNNPRILKKDSVEAINRRNILESCKKSSAKPDFSKAAGWNSGRPASRSSSFTIAERKKSFELMANHR